MGRSRHAQHGDASLPLAWEDCVPASGSVRKRCDVATRLADAEKVARLGAQFVDAKRENRELRAESAKLEAQCILAIINRFPTCYLLHNYRLVTGCCTDF
jgi:hypothetical protein